MSPNRLPMRYTRNWVAARITESGKVRAGEPHGALVMILANAFKSIGKPIVTGEYTPRPGKGGLLCDTCGRRFMGDSVFRLHRAGAYAATDGSAPSLRRCRSERELEAKGVFYNDVTGFWSLPIGTPPPQWNESGEAGE